MRNGKNFIITQHTANHYIQMIADWIRSKVREANRKGVVLGMSGGVDCSVVARLCQIADVPTHLILMPYGGDMIKSKSYFDALELLKKFNFQDVSNDPIAFSGEFNFSYHCYNIMPAVDALWHDPVYTCESIDSSTETLTKANLMPRVRMAYLYQFAQFKSFFVVGTGNMSERTVGYFTKWGDGACDINPIGYLTKREVYILAEFLGVPNSIISKKPSAELWEGQTDEDELGLTYNQIDNYLTHGSSGSPEADALIEERKQLSRHKFRKIPVFEI